MEEEEEEEFVKVPSPPEPKFEVFVDGIQPIPKPRRTRPNMTKFERCRVVAMRTEQIGRGAVPLVEALDGDGPAQVAEQEFAAGRIPFIIRRYLPDGTSEDWRLDELGPCDMRLSHVQQRATEA